VPARRQQQEQHGEACTTPVRDKDRRSVDARHREPSADIVQYTQDDHGGRGRRDRPNEGEDAPVEVTSGGSKAAGYDREGAADECQ